MERIAAIVGAGLIGRAWAVVFARAGWTVRLFDAVPAQLAAARQQIAQSLTEQQQAGTSRRTHARRSTRIAPCTRLSQALTDAAWVQENLPEEVAIKRTAFAEFDRLASPDAILASSTSAIVASQFTADLAGRARCLVAHPVNPPHLVPVVEFCGAPWTSEATLDRARTTMASLGQVPVVVRREIEGFVLNRLQGALLSEAMRLVADGVVSPDDLDKTMRDGLGMRWSFMGPFETIELNAPGGVAGLLRALQRFLPPAGGRSCALCGLGRAKRRARRGCGARRAVDRRTARAAHRVARPSLAGAATAQT